MFGMPQNQQGGMQRLAQVMGSMPANGQPGPGPQFGAQMRPMMGGQQPMPQGGDFRSQLMQRLPPQWQQALQQRMGGGQQPQGGAGFAYNPNGQPGVMY